VEDLSSEWGDDDVDVREITQPDELLLSIMQEIVVMRKKTSSSLVRLSTIQEDDWKLKSAKMPQIRPAMPVQKRPATLTKLSTLHEFEILEGGDSELARCRRKETGVVYAVRRLLVEENENCWLEREILESLKNSQNPFAWKMHWAFEDSQFLYMVLVSVCLVGVSFSLTSFPFSYSGFAPMFLGGSCL